MVPTADFVTPFVFSFESCFVDCWMSMSLHGIISNLNSNMVTLSITVADYPSLLFYFSLEILYFEGLISFWSRWFLNCRWLFLCWLMLIFVVLQIISPYHLYLNPRLVVKQYQFWRLVTNFLYFRKMGKISAVHHLVNCYSSDTGISISVLM